MFKYKKTEDLEKMTPNELDAYKTELRAHETDLRNKEISETVKNEIAKANDTLKEFLGGEIANQLKDFTEKNQKTEQVKSIQEILEDNKEEILKAFSNGFNHEFTVSKASALTTSVANNTSAQRDNDISPLATKKMSIYDLFRKVRVGKNNNGTVVYYDWDEATTTRAAATIAEGGTFPESEVAWEEFSIKLKKIGDSIPMSEEFKYDTAMFADELESFLAVNVQLVQDAQILSGSGVGNNTTGLYTYAPAYTAPASGISDASIYDLIVKVAEDITKGKGGKFRPDFVMMNLTDINKMRLKKDQNENYILPPFVDRNGSVVAGISVIEENGLTANTLVMGDSRYGKIYEDESGYTLTTGVVNDQYIKDMETLKARKRLAFLIKNSELQGFRKVADIDASLVALA